MTPPRMNAQNQNAQPNAEQLLALFNQKSEVDWRQYWAVLWRRKWWVLAPVILITSASIAVAIFFIRPVFEVSATIQVLPSRLQRSVREVTPGVSNAVDYRELQKKILNTPNLLELIQRLELTKDAAATEEAQAKHAKAKWLPYDQVLQKVLLEMLRDNLAVQVNPGTQLFQITARNESPRMAFRLVKSLTDIFIDESKKNELRGIRGVMEFSNEQLEIYKQKVHESERKLQELQERRASKQVQAIGMDANSVMQLRQFIKTSENAISERRRRLASLQEELLLPAIDLLWERETRLQQVKAKVEVKMEEFKRTTIAVGLRTDSELTLDNEINVLRQEYHRFLQEAVPRVYSNLNEVLQSVMIEYQLGQIDLYIFRTRAQVANELLARYAEMSAAAPADEIELRRLEAELQQNRRIYEVFLEQSRGSQIEEALQNSDADFKYSVIEAATMPVEPVGGSKKAFVLGAFGVSVILGLSLVVVLELSDQSIRNVKDAEQLLAAPVWGVIPKINVSFQVWQHSLEEMYKSGAQARASSAPRSAHKTQPSQAGPARPTNSPIRRPKREPSKTAKTSSSAPETKSPRAESGTQKSPQALRFTPIPRPVTSPKASSVEAPAETNTANKLPVFRNGAQEKSHQASPDKDDWIV